MQNTNITHLVAVRTPTGSTSYKDARDTHFDAINDAIERTTGRIVCIDGPKHLPNGPTTRSGEWITYLHISE
jgi:hypothetical protein